MERFVALRRVFCHEDLARAGDQQDFFDGAKPPLCRHIHAPEKQLFRTWTIFSLWMFFSRRLDAPVINGQHRPLGLACFGIYYQIMGGES